MDHSTWILIAEISNFIATLFAIVFVADLLVGFVHWAEDNYGQVHWPIIGKSVIEPNLLHHSKPKAFCKNNWWQSADYQIMGALTLMVIASFGGWLHWELVAVLALAVNGNEVHKWSHRSKQENGKLITWLQDHKLIQSRRQHSNHHSGDKNTYYCTLTEWVNPILEKIHFWRSLEWTIEKVTGVSPRVDPAVLKRQARERAQASTITLPEITYSAHASTVYLEAV